MDPREPREVRDLWKRLWDCLIFLFLEDLQLFVSKLFLGCSDFRLISFYLGPHFHHWKVNLSSFQFLNDKIDQNNNFVELPSFNWLSLSQFLRYIMWFKSQDLPFNGENVGPIPLFCCFIAVVFHLSFEGNTVVSCCKLVVGQLSGSCQAVVRQSLGRIALPCRLEGFSVLSSISIYG